jgi:hypothetical protein
MVQHPRSGPLVRLAQLTMQAVRNTGIAAYPTLTGKPNRDATPNPLVSLRSGVSLHVQALHSSSDDLFQLTG